MNEKQNNTILNENQAMAFALTRAFLTVANLADTTKRAELARLAMVKGVAK